LVAFDLDAMQRIVRIVAPVLQSREDCPSTEIAADTVGELRVFDLLAEIIELLLNLLLSALTALKFD